MTKIANAMLNHYNMLAARAEASAQGNIEYTGDITAGRGEISGIGTGEWRASAESDAFRDCIARAEAAEAEVERLRAELAEQSALYMALLERTSDW